MWNKTTSDLEESKRITICIHINESIDPSTLEPVYYDPQTKQYSTEGLRLILNEDDPSSMVYFETSHLLGEMALQITSDADEDDGDAQEEQDSSKAGDDVGNEDAASSETSVIIYLKGSYISLVYLAMLINLN